MNKKLLGQWRFGATAAVAASALLMAGCANGPASSDQTGSASGDAGAFAASQAVYDELLSNPPLKVEPLPKPAEKGVTVAVVNCTLPACLPGGGAEPGAALGWNVKDFPYDLAKGPSDVVAAMDAAIGSKPDVLIVAQNNAASLIQNQIEAAVATGIKVINIGSLEDPPGYLACIQCAPAADAQGAALANVALADAGSKTSIGFVTDKNISALVAIAKGGQSTVEKNGGGSTAKLLELSVVDNPAANAARTVSFLQRNPDVKYLVFTSPAFLPGTSSALKAAGLDVKKIVLNPSNDGDVEMVKTGDVDLWVAGESGDKAYIWRVFDAAARAVQDAPIDPKQPITAMRLITPDNADPSLQAPADFKKVYKSAWGVN